MILHDSIENPPPEGKLVLGVWDRGGVPDHVGLVIKGSIVKNEWHAPRKDDEGKLVVPTVLSVVAFGPTYWVALEDMPPCPDRRSQFPKFTPKFSLYDYGWPAC